MKALRLRAFGGPEQLHLEDLPMPSPAEHEVRLRVHAAGLNFTDLGQREGRLPGAPTPPFTPGWEAAGVIDAVGASVQGFAPGMRVVALLPAQGGFAEYALVPASALLPLPERVSFEQAVALPVQAPTALLALCVGARLQPGESVFIPSAAGGVGTLLVQLARALGASRVIAGVGSEAKRALVTRLGADATVDTSLPDWPARVREATAGRGVDVVFISGGAESGAQGLQALAPRGRLVLFGAQSMFDSHWSREQMMALVAQNQSITGFATFSLPLEQRQEALREALARVDTGTLEVVVGQSFPLEDVAHAHRALAARTTTGKVVIHIPQRSASSIF
ncbi:zinc-binding alcohol dehydrogenase family protein [Myxococcus sp. K15C18031901]|uniref:quinone oxidoreductase family protein n=1 Tax=Myxococcus dinghuensis TaxID=2906761 RepID=UPI0020A77BE9|nr:zinc-binding alcohol dehydrogenase family protein [Myxococcus dinghuensis]MCP3099731.1 zinc-binding alcohol dehydrogenase family protein [Myxococcus dinghuensis]